MLELVPEQEPELPVLVPEQKLTTKMMRNRTTSWMMMKKMTSRMKKNSSLTQALRPIWFRSLQVLSL
ncbi:hypothetical protein J42TS3_16970 [Paenibacillus vini]|uniref:Uncharacterized protein n=1 Tax=Paenibacillus vini TaxID=1476024 RepID=A0ABQ4MAI2_9BACL|nr:hypothetical protein J42TS3_16970 [Paenibacillus vini]